MLHKAFFHTSNNSPYVITPGEWSTMRELNLSPMYIPPKAIPDLMSEPLDPDMRKVNIFPSISF